MSSVAVTFRFADYARFLWDLLSGKRQRSEYAAAERRARDCAGVLRSGNAPLTILDVGSGKLRPQYTILRRQGHRVIGVDLANSQPLSLESVAYVFARFLYNLRCQEKGEPRFRDELLAADVGHLPLPDGCIDLVTSVAAFEHFLDVPQVVKELYRVTKPGAALWIAIHPFPSLSGGHNVSCRLGIIDTMPKGFEPWDHLRKRKHPFTVPLNEWRHGQYVEEFKKFFEIVSVTYDGPEGEHLFTPEIESELASFERRELLSPGLVLVMRRGPCSGP